MTKFLMLARKWAAYEPLFWHMVLFHWADPLRARHWCCCYILKSVQHKVVSPWNWPLDSNQNPVMSKMGCQPSINLVPSGDLFRSDPMHIDVNGGLSTVFRGLGTRPSNLAVLEVRIEVCWQSSGENLHHISAPCLALNSCQSVSYEYTKSPEMLGGKSTLHSLCNNYF